MAYAPLLYYTILGHFYLCVTQSQRYFEALKCLAFAHELALTSSRYWLLYPNLNKTLERQQCGQFKPLALYWLTSTLRTRQS